MNNPSLNIEEKVLTLTPVSPIHISNGQFSLSAMDIKLKNEEYEELFIINEDALSKLIGEKNAAKDYTKFVKKWIAAKKVDKNNRNIIVESEEVFNSKKKYCYKLVKEKILQTFLETRLGIKNIEEWCNKNCLYKIKIYSNDKFISDGAGNPYIPGSSIKGAIRTAIVWRMIKSNRRFDIQNQIREHLYDCLSYFSSLDRTKYEDIIKDIDKRDIKYFKDCYLPNKANSILVLKKGLDISDVVRLITIFRKDNNMKNYIDINKLLYPFKELNNYFFEDYDLKAKVIKDGVEKSLPVDFINWKSALANFMKSVQIIDTEEIITSTGKVKVFSIDGSNEFSEKKENFGKREVLQSGNIAFNIILDMDVLTKFKNQSATYGFALPFNSLDEVLQIVNDFYAEVWREEKEFFVGDTIKGIKPAFTGNTNSFKTTVDFYNRNDEFPNFRLGWGSGLLGVTIFTLLNKDYRKAIRDLIKNKDITVAPKSRRLIEIEIDKNSKKEKRILPFGWAIINLKR